MEEKESDPFMCGSKQRWQKREKREIIKYDNDDKRHNDMEEASESE
jgi:hypothetical protein